jgi:hypothetical protein
MLCEKQTKYTGISNSKNYGKIHSEPEEYDVKETAGIFCTGNAFFHKYISKKIMSFCEAGGDAKFC